MCFLKASRNVRQLRSGAVPSVNLFTTTTTSSSDCLLGTPTPSTTQQEIDDTSDVEIYQPSVDCSVCSFIGFALSQMALKHFLVNKLF